MTRNNLQDHLRWLCRTHCTIPPPPPASNLSTSTFGAETFALSQPATQTLDLSQVNGHATPAKNDSPEPKEDQFIRPSLPASVLNSRPPEAMARLQSASKSANRHRLLSHAPSEQTRTPLPRSSLQDQYNAAYQRNTPSTCNLGSSSHLLVLM